MRVPAVQHAEPVESLEQVDESATVLGATGTAANSLGRAAVVQTAARTGRNSEGQEQVGPAGPAEAGLREWEWQFQAQTEWAAGRWMTRAQEDALAVQNLQLSQLRELKQGEQRCGYYFDPSTNRHLS